MPKTKSMRGPALRSTAPELTAEIELFLSDGFDMFGGGFKDRKETMRLIWEDNKERLYAKATREKGPGEKPWAHFVFELNNSEAWESAL